MTRRSDRGRDREQERTDLILIGAYNKQPVGTIEAPIPFSAKVDRSYQIVTRILEELIKNTIENKLEPVSRRTAGIIPTKLIIPSLITEFSAGERRKYLPILKKWTS